jgi:hypothetical protein
MKSYGYRDIFTAGVNSRQEVEGILKRRYEKYLNNLGLPVEEFRNIEWKDNKVRIHAKVGRCKYLYFLDNLAYCLNYDSRPKQCRDYICKKIKKQILLEKARAPSEA